VAYGRVYLPPLMNMDISFMIYRDFIMIYRGFIMIYRELVVI
jgi:hypothetical protein